MADFPAKVSTETSSPQSQQGHGGFPHLDLDVSFIRTVPAILMMAQIVLGLLVWALVSSATYWLVHAYGWVLFVSVTLWILTILLFIALLCGIRRKVTSVPWPLAVMVFNAVATVLYLTAFIANAASVNHYYYIPTFYNNMAAAAFFGIVVTVLYGASTFFSFLSWKADGGNAASSTAPA